MHGIDLKAPCNSTLVKKSDYDFKISEIENKLSDVTNVVPNVN